MQICFLFCGLIWFLVSSHLFFGHSQCQMQPVGCSNSLWILSLVGQQFQEEEYASMWSSKTADFACLCVYRRCHEHSKSGEKASTSNAQRKSKEKAPAPTASQNGHKSSRTCLSFHINHVRSFTYLTSIREARF